VKQTMKEDDLTVQKFPKFFPHPILKIVISLRTLQFGGLRNQAVQKVIINVPFEESNVKSFGGRKKFIYRQGKLFDNEGREEQSRNEAIFRNVIDSLLTRKDSKNAILNALLFLLLTGTTHLHKDVIEAVGSSSFRMHVGVVAGSLYDRLRVFLH